MAAIRSNRPAGFSAPPASRPKLSRLAIRWAVAFLGIALASTQASAQYGPQPQYNVDLVSHTRFRVCASPNDMPLSNEKQAGFENKIASLFADTLKLPLKYTWTPITPGWLAQTLFVARCDVVIGTAAGGGMMDNTNPYYHSAYVIITRADDHLDATSVTDPSLAKLKFGIIAGTPPTDLLVKHKLINQTTPFNLNDSTHFDSIARQMLQDLLDKKIDVALLWGPYAGYYIVHEHLPVKVALLQTEPNGPRLDYRIAMGVRPNEVEWRRKLNRLLLSNKDAIDKILKDYGVPMLDEQGRPVYMPAP